MAGKPEQVLRIGNVPASIFVNEVEYEGGKRVLRSVSIQKRYRDGDETRYSSSFNLAELPQVLRVAELATRHIEAHEAEIQFD